MRIAGVCFHSGSTCCPEALTDCCLKKRRKHSIHGGALTEVWFRLSVSDFPECRQSAALADSQTVMSFSTRLTSVATGHRTGDRVILETRKLEGGSRLQNDPVLLAIQKTDSLMPDSNVFDIREIQVPR